MSKKAAFGKDFREKIEKLFKSVKPSDKKYVSWLYEIATHDEKTGLYNMKFFDNVFNMEIEKARRNQEHLSLFMIDVDFFKKINDKYGHMKADEFLVRLSKMLVNQLRTPDVIARFGGEEFMILLPQTDLEKAKTITSRLRDAIKSDTIFKKYGLTVSGGLTEYRRDDSEKKIKERVDQALYKAKQTGRDKFVALD
ncbi:MAG: GGDEF domain-containing protein [Candidatus Pacearchaeota archaeon]|jgi:diguanylate cyclase (GGDEF)-like protein